MIRTIVLFRTIHGEQKPVARFVSSAGGPVGREVLDARHQEAIDNFAFDGVSSTELGRRVTVADGDDFLDTLLRELTGTYWRAIEE